MNYMNKLCTCLPENEIGILISFLPKTICKIILQDQHPAFDKPERIRFNSSINVLLKSISGNVCYRKVPIFELAEIEDRN